MKILEKLKHIQQELNAPKKQYNEYGKYNYRNCEDICEAVKPLLEKYGCIVTLRDELVLIGERYYVKATATLIDTEENDSEIYGGYGSKYENIAYAREEAEKKGMDGSQITGASSSYARKYALNGLFLIDDARDSDTTNKHEKDKTQDKKPAEKKTEPKPAEKKETITEAQVQSLIKKCDKEGVAIEKICRLYKVKALTELSPKQYENIIKFWDKVKAAE